MALEVSGVGLDSLGASKTLSTNMDFTCHFNSHEYHF